jgi:hypothetical protein
VGDGPELAIDSVVSCNIVHNKTTYANSEGSKSMLSSLNNSVNNLHPQGVMHTSLERERPTLHAESTHPQGVERTSLEKERISPHAESQAPLVTGSSDALVLLSRKRLTASRGRT